MTKKISDADIGAKEDLNKRIQEMNKRRGRDIQKPEDENSGKPNRNNFGNAFKMSSEFISAILVGTVIGYTIDSLAGTKPWAMIVMFMLGFVAGIMNVLRASGEMSGSDNQSEE